MIASGRSVNRPPHILLLMTNYSCLPLFVSAAVRCLPLFVAPTEMPDAT
jgi:hypothetical protein